MLELNFPSIFKKSSLYPELVSLVESITNHEAMYVKEQHILENMIRASLLFTVCFYANLLSLLFFEVKRLKGKNPFAVQENTQLAYLLLNLSLGEIATKNIPTRKEFYCPHYVPMLEAAYEAGIDTKKIEEFVRKANTKKVKELTKELKFSKPIKDYLEYSEECTKSFEGCLATIALRELTLSFNFRVISENTPKNKKYEKYKSFLSGHIVIDEHYHSKLMKEALTNFKDVDKLINIMINFYKLRKRIYDECLLSSPIY